MFYLFIEVCHCSPDLTDNMAVERDEDDKRDDEDDDGHPTEIHLAEDGWPAGEVTDTLWLEGAVELWLPQLHGEGGDAGEGGDEGDEPGSNDKAVRRPGDCKRSGDGAVPVEGDHGKHVVGEGKGEGLEELKCIEESTINTQVLLFTHLKCLASH